MSTTNGPAPAIQPCNGLTRTGLRIEARVHLDHLHRVLVARAMQRHYGQPQEVTRA